MKKRWRRTRAFCAAFALTACVLSVGAGLLIADINTRRMTYGDSGFQMDYAIAAGEALTQPVLGTASYEAGEEPSAAQRLFQLLPARVRACAWLLEAERRITDFCTEALLSS